MPQAGIDPPAQRYTSYEASAQTPSHHRQMPYSGNKFITALFPFSGFSGQGWLHHKGRNGKTVEEFVEGTDRQSFCKI